MYFPYLDLDLIQQLGETVPKESLDAALMCRAIGDPTRNAILKMLAKEPQPAVSLATKLDLTRATISHHISVLKEAGVLSDDGTGRKLQIKWESLSSLSDLLVAGLRRQNP